MTEIFFAIELGFSTLTAYAFARVSFSHVSPHKNSLKSITLSTNVLIVSLLVLSELTYFNLLGALNGHKKVCRAVCDRLSALQIGL